MVDIDMTHSSNIYEPNQNIIINDNTEIISIDGQTVKAPARVILRLLPRPSMVIECDDFPPNFPSKNEFDISLQKGTPIPVHCTQVNISEGKIKVIFVPTKSHLTVFNKKKRLQITKFVILNFPFRFNKINLEADGWLVKLTATPNLQKSLEILKTYGGYAITYVGAVKKSDGSLFSVDDCKHILFGLEWFLSFARSTNCALALINGYNQGGEVSWKQWGLGGIDPWSYEDDLGMPNIIDNNLPTIFPGFWDQLRNNKRGITQCLDWYLRSNTSDASHVKIVLNQASLEILCSLICGNGGKFADKLRCSLKKLNIDTAIPSNYQELEKIRVGNKYSDSPETLAGIRNDLVHSKSKLGTISLSAYLEALNLSRRYIEMMLLHQFKYMDEYQDRLTQKIELVPWVKNVSP